MPKDKLWFTHDLNARNDRKIAPLVKEYKSAGYGIFWCAVEMMHEEGGELEFDEITFSAIAKDLNEDEKLVSEVISKCVEKYKLFTISENSLISNRVRNNIDEMKESRDKKSRAGKASAEARKSQQRSTDVQQCLSDDEQNPTQTNKQTDSSLGNNTLNQGNDISLVKTDSVSNPQTLTKKMMSIYITAHPKYRGMPLSDEYFCGEIANVIAEINGWPKESVTNGKMQDVLNEWQSCMSFAKGNKFWVQRTPKDLKDFDTFQKLHNAINFEDGTTNKFVTGKDDPCAEKF